MRFLITLLALITGFSAADAARVQDVGAQAAVALDAATALESADAVQVAVQSEPAVQPFAPPLAVQVAQALEIAVDTPVTRADLAHE